MESIRKTTPEAIKSALRKVRTVSGKVKAIVYAGNRAGPSLASQFNQDVAIYSLWEACLYIEGYEGHGEYAPGTASAVIAAAITPRMRKLVVEG